MNEIQKERRFAVMWEWFVDGDRKHEWMEFKTREAAEQFIQKTGSIVRTAIRVYIAEIIGEARLQAVIVAPVFENNA